MIKEDVNKQASSLRSYWIGFRLTEGEYRKIMAKVDKPLHKSLSSYARKLLLGKPVAIITRDISKDKTIEELAALRSQLGAIAGNFNQVVRRIHRLNSVPNKLYWLINYRQLQRDLLHQIEFIQQHISKISDQWSQNSSRENR